MTGQKKSKSSAVDAQPDVPEEPHHPSASTTGSKRAWADEDDEGVSLPAFQTQQHKRPNWSVTDAKRESLQGAEDDDEHSAQFSSIRKRFRSEDLERLLSQTAPLLSANPVGSRKAAPKVLSIVPLPRDTARSIHWHPSGQLLIVGGNHHMYLFHTAGKYVEQLSKVSLGHTTLAHSCLAASSEDVLVAQRDAYLPVRLHLATQQLTSLKFLDTRNTAAHRLSGAEVPKAMRYISKMVTPPATSSSPLVAVASGSKVQVGSLSSGCLTCTVAVDAPVADMQFVGDQQLYIASGNRLLLYDVRQSSRFLKEYVDEAALTITSFAVTRKYIAIGSSSGVVSLSHRGENGCPDTSSFFKSFSNLSTAITAVGFGEGSDGLPSLCFSTVSQKAGFRLAHLPDAQVIPSFPAVSSRHEFIQSVAFAPTLPVFSVGERKRVVNYGI